MKNTKTGSKSFSKSMEIFREAIKKANKVERNDETMLKEPKPVSGQKEKVMEQQLLLSKI